MQTPIIELAERLDGIIHYNRSATKSFAHAATKCESNELSVYFKQMAYQRKYFTEELNRTLDSLCHNFESSGKNKINILKNHESKFSGEDEEMLQESILREKGVVKAYGSLLTDFIMPKSTAVLLRNQMLKIEANLALIKSLSDLKKTMLEPL